MKISQIASVLGLDETGGVRVTPLTDADLAAASDVPPTPQPPRRERRRKQRPIINAKGG